MHQLGILPSYCLGISLYVEKLCNLGLQKTQSCRLGHKWIPNDSVSATLLTSYSITQKQLDMRVTALANPVTLTDV